MTELHRCKAVGCVRNVAPSVASLKVFLCGQHYAMVPDSLKRLLTERSREGESPDYIATVFVVLSLVANEENEAELNKAPDQRKKEGKLLLPTLTTMTKVAEPLLAGVRPYPD
jgi:hypothetical protein